MNKPVERPGSQVKDIHHYINGREVAGTSGRYGDVYNPALGEVAGRVAFASTDDVSQAVAAAQSAFPGWAATPPLRRARVMFKFKELVERDHDKLARLISSEHGKVVSDARGEVTRGLEVVEFACGIPHLLKGDYSEQVGTGIDTYSMRQALGVCAGITPFNFPAMVPMWMFPIAIACGNTFVLKPSERDPSAEPALGQPAQGGGIARRSIQRRARRQSRGGRAAQRSAHCRGQLRRLYAHRRVHLSNRDRVRKARAGAGRCQESSRGDARRGSGASSRCAHGRGLRFGRRALHGDLRRSRGGGGRGRAGRASGGACHAA